MELNTFIQALQHLPDSVVWMFRHGGCYAFYQLVHQLFPQAEALYDGDHVLVRVGDTVFDAVGLREPNERHDLIDPLVAERAVTWVESLPRRISWLQ